MKENNSLVPPEPDLNISDSESRPRPVVLLLLDGWGIAPAGAGNAISTAKTPVFLNLIKEYPSALLDTGGKSLNVRYLELGTGREIESENGEPLLSLSRVLADAGLRQKKITETERFAALTYFFNGRVEEQMENEEWQIVSSEINWHGFRFKNPSRRITKELLKNIKQEPVFDFIVAVLPALDLAAANADFETVRKISAVLDDKLEEIVEAVLARDGVLFLSAACGNAEKTRIADTELMDREMTDNPVPVIIVGNKFKGRAIDPNDTISGDLSLSSPSGTLADIVPTILGILGLEKTAGMTGENLLERFRKSI
jgi:bisphosphoglycerate-independent phosphoglycerate mutase (AlkP superfamily)